MKLSKIKITEVDEIPVDVKNFPTFLIKGKGVTDHTHGIFKYPCKFIPHVPRWFFKKYGSNLTKKYGVLDPFSGSGTTLVESSLLGFPSYGVDIDPLSILLSQVKSTKLSSKEIDQLMLAVNYFNQHLENKYSLTNVSKFIPKFKEVDYWFPKETINELAHIKYLINSIFVKNGNKKIRNILTITLASVIRRVSLAEEQSPKPYISKKIKKTPAKVYPLYLKNLSKYSDAIIRYSKVSIISGKVIGFDARKINKKQIKAAKVHLAMTSPPYINAFDYVRSLKLENIWLDSVTPSDISSLYDRQIGTEKIPASRYKNLPSKTGIMILDKKIADVFNIDKKRAHVIYDYFTAMSENLKEIHSTLVPNGYYCMVVGNSNIRQIYIPTDEIIVKLAKKAGFMQVDNFSYIIRNRYLRIPRMGRGGFIPKDYILVFKKQ